MSSASGGPCALVRFGEIETHGDAQVDDYIELPPIDSSDEEDVKPADEKQRLVQERVSEHVPAITSARASPRADATAQRVEPRVSQKKKASPEIIDSKLLRSLERGQEHGAENLTHLDHLKPVEPSPKDTSSHAQPVEPPANLRADITLSEPNVDPKSAGTLPVTRIEALAEHVEPSGQKVGADTSATHSPPDKSASRARRRFSCALH